MDRNSEMYKVGLALHGHKCPAMPLGSGPDWRQWRPLTCSTPLTAS
jgi:hypothetical protein